MKQRTDEMLSHRDKEKSVSDTVYHSGLIREAFPKERYGGAKPAIYAAYRYIAPKVAKKFTERRARAIWEGTARRIDAEESAILKRAQYEEAKREQQELRARLVRLDAVLAVVNQEEAREAGQPVWQQVGGVRRVANRTGMEG